jgi:hypothetical protein
MKKVEPSAWVFHSPLDAISQDKRAHAAGSRGRLFLSSNKSARQGKSQRAA